MSKHIANGMDALAKSMNRDITDQWRSFRNKLDSLLMSGKVLKTDQVQTACGKIDAMSHDERLEYIAKTWGPMYAQKAEPLLHQLHVLEMSAEAAG